MLRNAYKIAYAWSNETSSKVKVYNFELIIFIFDFRLFLTEYVLIILGNIMYIIKSITIFEKGDELLVLETVPVFVSYNYI